MKKQKAETLVLVMFRLLFVAGSRVELETSGL